MTCLMKVLQIESVVPNLIDRRPIERLLADFEFDSEDNRPNHQHHINPPPHAWDVELEEDRASETDELVAQ